jgi:hypothetical protein
MIEFAVLERGKSHPSSGSQLLFVLRVKKYSMPFPMKAIGKVLFFSILRSGRTRNPTDKRAFGSRLTILPMYVALERA